MFGSIRLVAFHVHTVRPMSQGGQQSLGAGSLAVQRFCIVLPQRKKILYEEPHQIVR